jgi:hypothetical protein
MSVEKKARPGMAKHVFSRFFPPPAHAATRGRLRKMRENAAAGLKIMNNRQ